MTLMFVIVDHSSVLTVNVLVKLSCCYEKRKDEWSTRLFLSNLKIGHILVALLFDHHIIDLQSYHNLSCEPLQINYESDKQVYNLRHVLFISQILRYLHQIKWWSETHGWPIFNLPFSHRDHVRRCITRLSYMLRTRAVTKIGLLFFCNLHNCHLSKEYGFPLLLEIEQK